MKASQALQVLAQVPGSYPLQVEQDGRAHEVLSLEYSHDPARAVVKIAPAADKPNESAPVPMPKAFIVGMENLTNTLLAALDVLGAPEDTKKALTESGDCEHVHWWLTQNRDIAAFINAHLGAVVMAIETMRETNRADKNLEDVQQMLKGALTCWRKHAEPAAEESTERCESGCDAPVVTHDAEGVPLCKECAEDLAKEVGIYSWSTENGDGQSGSFDTIEEALADAEEDLRQREANATVIVWDSRPATADDRELFDGPKNDRDPIDFTDSNWFVRLRVPENEVASREFRFAKPVVLPEPEATSAELNGEVPPAPAPVELAPDNTVIEAPVPAKKTRRAKGGAS